MPQIELNQGVAVPAPLMQAQLIDLLRTVESAEPPFQEFTITVDLGDLHLPNAGIVAVPIALRCSHEHNEIRSPIGFSFQARQHEAFFPSFAGTLSAEDAGAPYSCVCDCGANTAPRWAPSAECSMPRFCVMSRNARCALFSTRLQQLQKRP